MASSKAELRAQLRAARKTLTPEDYATQNQAIVEHLSEVITAHQPGVIHCFTPRTDIHEPDISQIIDELRRAEPSVSVYTTQKIDGTWQHTLWGGQQVVPAPHPDLIIVPMLGFDTDLHRLGHGGGFYDRFLAGQPQAYKLGVCFEAGKLDSLPHEPHDIPMDQIITESHLYS